MAAMEKKKRAITLAGGGPAAGLHLGALFRLEEEPSIEFDVWALSCIGAWVGIVYHSRKKPIVPFTFSNELQSYKFNTPVKDRESSSKALDAYKIFHENVFRDDASYQWFPINRAFAPSYLGFGKAWASFGIDRSKEWGNFFQPMEIFAAGLRSLQYLTDPTRWFKESEFNLWLLNDVLAVHPASRYLTSLSYLSQINGLSRIYYPESGFLDKINIPSLAAAAPDIYHNAWRFAPDGKGELQIFHNHPEKDYCRKQSYMGITPASLCACSALPYVEETVRIQGKGSEEYDEYCEGALVDTVNFKDLLRDHAELDEIWVNRIVDVSQVKQPKNIADGLANLAMLFAAEVGSNDVKLFRQHLLNQPNLKTRLVEIKINTETKVTFEWNHKNLDTAFCEGYEAVDRLLKSDGSLLSPIRS